MIGFDASAFRRGFWRGAFAGTVTGVVLALLMWPRPAVGSPSGDGQALAVATSKAAPDLGGGPVHELDYSPAIGVREVRPRCIDERRDMTLAEEARAVALLREMCPSQWGDLVT